MQPLGVMKTDYPVRVFRNNAGIKFYGVVHEHPEQELNKGVGHVIGIQEVEIAHAGYTNEGVRRTRCGRHIDLLGNDRHKYPTLLPRQFHRLPSLPHQPGFKSEVQ